MGDGTAAKVTLTETYAGGMIYEECTSCVTEITNVAITSSRSVTTAIGEGFMVQGYTNINQVYSAKSANSPASPPASPRPSTGSSTAWATSLTRSPRPSAAPPTSTSPSAPTVAPATRPPACASASRATATTTATPRTCSPLNRLAAGDGLRLRLPRAFASARVFCLYYMLLSK